MIKSYDDKVVCIEEKNAIINECRLTFMDKTEYKL